ncbi:hypothetical protein ACWEF9_05670 [Streptomyces sp. NPDC004980]
MPGDDSHLIAQYDSLEDPEERSDFLEANGLTRTYITGARRRLRAAGRNTAATTPDSQPNEPSPPAPRRGAPRRCRRAPLTRPPGRSRLRRTRQRRTPRRITFVIIIEMD